ncbi:hypothetical protein [Xanthomonas sp. SI]|uniref:hypothetical protein n=1 Tax=Xanthomonas sp. SI TaxID=2724123 RepID=UPI0016398532|nr:hypothetical protein [Xanthomonas sp. SI]QNH13621.1 hypothetical protein HEP75_03073 [Xanthomonas sp. SI]
MKSNSNLLLALVLILSSASCASTGPATDKFQAKHMDENAEMTPSDLGHRFIEMIRDANSFENLSIDFIERSIGSPFKGDKKSGFFILKSRDENWEYGVTYNFDEKFNEYSNVTLELIRMHDWVDEYSPPCDIMLDDYVSALKSMGFSTEPPTYGEIGWLLSLQYIRNNMYVQIAPQHVNPSCVSSISIHKL